MSYSEEVKAIVALIVVVLYLVARVWLLGRRVDGIERWIGTYLEITGKRKG